MNRKRTVISSFVVLALIGAATWFWYARSEWQVDRIKELQSDVFSRETRELPEEERREKLAYYRQQYDKLSDAQKHQLRRQMSAGHQQRMSARIHTYFELSESERVAYLDKQIKEMEKRRKQSNARTKQSGARSGGRGGPGGVESRGGGRRGGAPDADRGDRREQFKRRMLDNTTPQQRAEMAAYMEAMKKRREELGLSSGGRGRPFRGKT